MITSLVLALSLASAEAEQPVKLSVTPSVCFEPCTMRIRLLFSQEVKEGQVVCIRLSDGVERSLSCWMHDGAKTKEAQIRDIPAGSYVVEAAVMQGRDKTTLEVR